MAVLWKYRCSCNINNVHKYYGYQYFTYYVTVC
jgi:hypothetical protein